MYRIGFFDSGLGGLTILRATAKMLPEFSYVFYGDTAHLPLGDKTEEEVFQYTKVGITELFDRDCLLVIVACNTASAESLRRIQDTLVFNEYPERRVLGVIIPTVEEIVEQHLRAPILLATKRTIDSGKYDTELKKQTIRTPVLTGIATPELVPHIEVGEIDRALHRAIEYVDGCIQNKPSTDGIVLGCTHYTLLTEGIRSRFPNIPILSQDEIVPKKLRMYLERHPEIEKRLDRVGERSVHLTKHSNHYDQLIGQFLDGSFI